MNRINRKDRVLLESMNEKYGTDVVAQAILALSGAEGESAQESPQVAILNFIQFLFGCMVRSLELHWATDEGTEHDLTRDLYDFCYELADEVAEMFMGIHDVKIDVNSIVPCLPNAKETKELVKEILCEIENLKQILHCDSKYDGIRSELRKVQKSLDVTLFKTRLK